MYRFNSVDRCFVKMGIFESANQDKADDSGSYSILLICLEMIDYLITSDKRTLEYFLTENHLLTNRFAKYPFILLLELLTKPTFENDPIVTIRLMSIIDSTCRPIPYIVKDEPDIKLPAVPDVLLQKLVGLISALQCSGQVFKNVLTVLTHVSFLSGVHKSVTECSVKAVISCTEHAMCDIDSLIHAVNNLKVGEELDRSILSQFATSNSNQAGLLRVIEILQYLYTCHLNPLKLSAKRMRNYC